MERKTLYLVRGLPGSGKTTLAKLIGGVMHAADDYFTSSDGYRFDVELLPKAHAYCLEATRSALGMRGVDRVIVHNTFTRRWEMEKYLDMGADMGARVVVISLFDGGLTDERLAERNLHGVPVETIANMRARFEHDIGTY